MRTVDPSGRGRGMTFLRWAPVVLVLVAVAARWLWPGGYSLLVDEDGAGEWATVVVYLAAAALAAATAPRLRRASGWWPALVVVALGLGFLGVALEEVSWGQRVVGFEGPQALVERNNQSEANVHNLLERPLLHGAFIAVGLYGAGLGRYLLARSRLSRWSWLLAPGPQLFWPFATVALVYAWYEVPAYVLEPLVGFGDEVRPGAFGLSRIQEVAELGLALGFLLFVLQIRAVRAATAPEWAPAEQSADSPR